MSTQGPPCPSPPPPPLLRAESRSEAGPEGPVSASFFPHSPFFQVGAGKVWPEKPCPSFPFFFPFSGQKWSARSRSNSLPPPPPLPFFRKVSVKRGAGFTPFFFPPSFFFFFFPILVFYLKHLPDRISYTPFPPPPSGKLQASWRAKGLFFLSPPRP